MKYLIENIKVSPTDNTDLYRILAQRLNIKEFKFKILSKSLDARDKTKTAHPATIFDHNGYPPYTPPWFLNNEVIFHTQNTASAAGAINLIEVINHHAGIL